ncbi:MAG: metal ABC transporter permease [Treponema sp.]|nr:metal ABC transporter permease [Treponema sp.]
MQNIYDVITIILPFEWLSPHFMKNAFLAILIAAPLFGMLGSVIVSNGMAFFSDAIGHSSLTGIALGVALGIREPTATMVIFSMLLGCTIIAVKSYGSTSSDTIIGVFSAVSVALGIVLLSSSGNFSKYQRYLVGDILSIQEREIIFLLCAALATVCMWVLLYNKMLLVNLHKNLAKSRGIHVFAVELLFALVIAVVVTIAIQWTGLLVINSLLVLPAAGARMISANTQRYVACAIIISLISGIAGLAFSYYAGAASGASIVLVNAALFALCFLGKVLRRN